MSFNRKMTMGLPPVVLDWETMYDPADKYSLTSMTYEEYVRDPRFQEILCSFYLPEEGEHWYAVGHKNIAAELRALRLHECAVVAHNCVTGDHEVLTTAGWVRFDQLQDGVEVLQVDVSTGEGSFVVPNKVIRNSYEGEMLAWDSRYHKGIYTPAHRFYYSTPDRHDWREKTAEDISQLGANNVYLPVTYWREGKGDQLPLPPEGLRLLEAVRADARIEKGHIKFHIKKPRKIERLKWLLDVLDISYSERQTPRDTVHIGLHHGPIVNVIVNYLTEDKSYPTAVLELPLWQRKVLVDEMRYWDGHSPERGEGFSVSSAKAAEIELFTHLARSCGFMVSAVSYDQPNTRGYSRPDGVLSSLYIRDKARVKLQYAPERIHFNGTVYCVNVPTGAFLVRRNGAVWVTGNCNFDGFILRDVHGIEAAEYICTLAMAKPHVGAKQSVSLAKLAELIGLPAKGKEVENVMGMRLEDFTPEGLKRYAAYGQRDDELCWGIFMKFRSFWDDMSMEIMSDTIRCGVVPQFQVDVPLLQGYLPLLEKRQKDLVDELAKDFGMSGEEMSKALGSNPKFAACLERLGVEPPTKVSEKTGKTSFAFAKTDMGFKELLESPDERVVTLCEARMGNKSSIGASRAQRLIDIGRRGRLPMPLDAFGAGTSRWTALGGQKINCFTPGHELLTPDGWVAVEDYIPGTPLAQWWPSGKINFDLNPGWLVKPYSGDVIDIDAPMVSATVTPDHRLCYVSQANGQIVHRTAQWLAEHSGMDSIPVTGIVDTEDAPVLDAELRYLVALQADGSVTKSGAHIFGFRKPRKIARLTEILDSFARGSYRKMEGHTTYFGLTKKAQTSFIAQTGKGFGPWLLKLSARQLNIICDEVRFWDGNANSNNGMLEFNAADRVQVLWLDTALRLCGRRGAVYEYPRHAGYDAVHRLYERKSPWGSVDTSRQVSRVAYEGLVYCPKVDADTVVVRHRGRIFMSPQCQNFPKRGGDITLRQSIMAPPGYHVVTCDLSQIEARRMAAQSGQWDLVEQFKHDLDPYSIFATELYGYPVSKHNGKKKERNVGKESILSMQYGSGGRAFWLRLRSAYNIYLEEDFCVEAVWKYRRKYKHITDFWNRCDQAIKVMRFGGEFAFGENDAYLAVKGGIYLPDDYFLKYDQIIEVENKETGKHDLMYMDRTKRSLRRLYRGIVANNVTQGSSARILQNHIKWLRDEGIFMCGTVHDELIFLVPDYDLEEQCALIESTMKRVPAWAEGTPVDCELTVGPNYGDQYDLPIYLEGGCTKLGAEAVIRERKRQAAN